MLARFSEFSTEHAQNMTEKEKGDFFTIIYFMGGNRCGNL